MASKKSVAERRGVDMSPAAPNYERAPMVAEVSGAAEAMAREAEDLVVASEEANTQASGLLAQVAQGKKKLESLRKFFVDPLNAQVKAVNAFFKEKGAPIERADAALRTKMLAWYNKKEADRRAEDARRAREHQDEVAKAALTLGDAPAPPEAAPEPERATRTEVGTTVIPMRWTWELADFAQVPAQYKQLNEVAVNKAIRDGERSIPGLVIKQVPYIVQR